MSLKITNLSKSFFQKNEEIKILHHLNFEISSGEIVSLIGPSGSGKSTFLSLVAGLDKPNSGEIYIDQTDIVGLSQKEMTSYRAKSLSLVFQQYHLIQHLTALENVLLPLEILNRENAMAQALEILDLVGLANRASHRPTQLSGGECQRVAIARALVVRPKLLLADEPSGNLDESTGDQVMNLFFKLTREFKTTTLIVTHSETLARKCEKIFRLKHGQIERLET